MNDTKKTILVCVDESAVRDELGNFLGEGGNTVLYATTANDGIRKIKDSKVDILVLDLSVPALNGYGFLESITNDMILTKTPKSIVIANSIDEIDEDKNITLGVESYVIKSSNTASDVAAKLLGDLGHASENILQADGFKVLMVEDDNFLRDLLARKLGQENCQFVAAIDGESALKIMDESKPSIVLLDLILPGIDGFEVLNKIKQNPKMKDVPVIILSNLGQDSDIQKAKELGADDFLIKANFSIDEVINKIKELVRRNS